MCNAQSTDGAMYTAALTIALSYHIRRITYFINNDCASERFSVVRSIVYRGRSMVTPKRVTIVH